MQPSASLVLTCCALIFTLSLAQNASHFDLTTSLGNITGLQSERLGVKYYSFYGIPYAKPPLSDLRFKKPEPRGAFESHNGTVFGNTCPSRQAFTGISGDEDCLVLNIQTTLNQTYKKPVMVWIHGGGYISGSANEYPGDAFVTEKDVVYVALNYRLGVLGFPPVKSNSEITANLGLWDQHLALKWVTSNIGDYGGDNESITIFGGSAGGGSVVSQMMSPHNDRSVFQRVVAQSHNFPTYDFVDTQPMSVPMFARFMECNSSTVALQIQCLRGQSSADLVRNLVGKPITIAVLLDDEFFSSNLLNDIYAALEDPTGSIKPDRLRHIGRYDLLMGWNNDDGLLTASLFGSFVTSDLSLGIPNAGMEAILGATLLGNVESADTRNFIFDALIAGYTQDISLERGQQLTGKTQEQLNLEILKRLGGDGSFTIQAARLLKLHRVLSNGTGTYGYVYTHRRSWPGTWPSPEWLRTGADHADEVLLLFGAPRLRDLLSGCHQVADLVQQSANYNFTATELTVSNLLMDYWTTFAVLGTPLADAENRDWPAYSNTQNLAQIDDDKTIPVHLPGKATMGLILSLDKAVREQESSNIPTSPQDPMTYASTTPEVQGGPGLSSPLSADQMFVVMIIVTSLTGALWLITLICCIKARLDVNKFSKNMKQHGSDSVGM